jgi:hypothetical protein
VDATALEVAADQVNGLSGDTPKTYKDYRELLAREKPDIVIIATPDHWHALNTVAAVSAGAHVFVEKPTGHTVNESRAMLKAVSASGRQRSRLALWSRRLLGEAITQAQYVMADHDELVDLVVAGSGGLGQLTDFFEAMQHTHNDRMRQLGLV